MTTVTESTINTGTSDEQRQEVVSILRRVLADESILYTKVRNYHWNVVGLQFHSLHELLEDEYEELEEVIDDVAERTRALGAPAIGTLSEFMQFTTLSEHPGEYPKATTMISNLVNDYEQIIRNLREDVQACEQANDPGTADFLTGVMEKHEKSAWMLRSFLEDRPA